MTPDNTCGIMRLIEWPWQADKREQQTLCAEFAVLPNHVRNCHKPQILQRGIFILHGGAGLGAARRGSARLGLAGHGLAGPGKARQGKGNKKLQEKE